MIENIKYFVDKNERLIDQQHEYNKTMNSKVAIQLDEKVVTGQVKQQELLPEGKIVGRYNENPMMNSMIYGV